MSDGPLRELLEAVPEGTLCYLTARGALASLDAIEKHLEAQRLTISKAVRGEVQMMHALTDLRIEAMAALALIRGDDA